MSKIIGLDVGYGFVKVTDGETGFSFPSVVGEGHNKPIFQVGPQQLVNNLSIEINNDNKIHFVGKSAIRHSKYLYRDLSTARSQTNDLRALVLGALVLFCSSHENRFKIVTGLPVGRMHLADDLIDQIKGSFSVKTYRNNKTSNFEIIVSEVEVVPQPLGSYWVQSFNSSGMEPLKGRTGIIDVGFRTADLAVIDEGDYVPEKSRTINLGLNTAYKEIGNIIFANYGLERETYALDEAVIKGTIRVAGNEVDISDMKRKAFESLAANIRVEISSSWSLPEFDNIIVSGGGGQALSSYLAPHFRQAKLMADSLTANSRGYLAWAKYLWLNGVAED